MAKAGIHPHRGGDELLHCPWHDDQHSSLSVNWEAAVFICFAQSCGVQGGIGALRRRLVGEKPARRSQAPVGRAAGEGEGRRAAPEVDVERARLRLVSATKAAGLGTFNQRTGRALFEEILECHSVFKRYECPERHRVAERFSCGFPLCPVCVPSRLAADFRRHAQLQPGQRVLDVACARGLTRVQVGRLAEGALHEAHC